MVVKKLIIQGSKNQILICRSHIKTDQGGPDLRVAQSAPVSQDQRQGEQWQKIVREREAGTRNNEVSKVIVDMWNQRITG